MKLTKQSLVASVIIVTVGLTGCNTNPSKQDIGLVTGAVVGGVVGSAITGGTTFGTVTGAAAGGLIGRKIGKDLERK